MPYELAHTRGGIKLQTEFILFIIMISIFMVSCFLFKLPVSIAMVLAAISGAIVGGYGVPIDQLIEGTFAYIDTILIIATAMIFMKVVQESGALHTLNSLIIKKFHKKPVLMLIFLMLIVMFPGMITGSSTAAVLSAGALVAPVLMTLGIPRDKTGAIIAIGGILGMIAPPVNVPAMIIGGGIDLPYVGFTVPLLLLTIPLAIFTVLFLGLRHVKDFDYDSITNMNITSKAQGTDFGSNILMEDNGGIIVFLPILLVLVLMVSSKLLPTIVPDLGMPPIFVIGSIAGLITGKRVNIIKATKEAINSALPVLGILMGVGMFIQIMTLTGVRGFIVINSLSLPSVLLYLGIAVAIPAFGAVSAFGSASILGVPFVLALLGKNEIITTASLSLIAGLGDLVPPTALAGIFAAQVVGEQNYFKVLKKCLVPAMAILIWGLLFVIFAKPIGSIIF